MRWLKVIKVNIRERVVIVLVNLMKLFGMYCNFGRTSEEFKRSGKKAMVS